MSPKKLLFTYVRSVTGLIAGGLFWLALGWGLSSWALGAVLAAWAVLIGPWLIPSLTWISFRTRRLLKRVDLGRDHALACEFFATTLAKPGPWPNLWVREANDLSCIWFERPWPGPSRQEIVVTSAWLAQDPELRAADWKSLWNTIAAASREQRRLRTFQMACWTGMVSPFEPLLYGLTFVFELFDLGDIPPPALWFQRICWMAREIWFGLPPDTGVIPHAPAHLPARPPLAWNSVIWGVWFQIPAHASHPLWLVLTHREAFLERSP